MATITYPDSVVTYGYDKAGNRTREITTGASASDKTFGYDNVNRLTAITDTTTGTEPSRYAYDASGNTTSRVTGGVETKFLFDIRNQLGEVQQGASILGRYGYDYDGRRIVKIGAEGRQHYTYDQQSVITEADTNNETVLKYDYGLDQLVSLRQRGGNRSFYHLDALGSTVNLTTDAGDTQESLFYDAWGRERFRFGLSPNHFTFTGYEADRETKLFYALSRFYDPETGRFLSQDSYLGDPMEPPSLHRFTYGFSNPLRFVDPTGHFSLDYAKDFAVAFGKDIFINSGERLLRIGASAVKNAAMMVVEAGAQVHDVTMLTLDLANRGLGGDGLEFDLWSNTAKSSGEQLAQGKSVTEITLGNVKEIALGTVTAGIYPTVKEQYSALSDFASGKASIEDVENRLIDAAGGSVLNLALTAKFMKATTGNAWGPDLPGLKNVPGPKGMIEGPGDSFPKQGMLLPTASAAQWGELPVEARSSEHNSASSSLSTAGTERKATRPVLLGDSVSPTPGWGTISFSGVR